MRAWAQICNAGLGLGPPCLGDEVMTLNLQYLASFPQDPTLARRSVCSSRGSPESGLCQASACRDHVGSASP